MGEGGVAVRLLEVGHVLGLSHHLIMSFRLIADTGNCYTGTSEGITKVF